MNNKQRDGDGIVENTRGVFSLFFVPYFSSLTRIFVAYRRVLKGVYVGPLPLICVLRFARRTCRASTFSL